MSGRPMPERPSPFRFLGLVVVVGLGVAISAPFAAWPTYRHLDDGLAVVKLSFDHEGQRAEPCRALTEAEIAALPKHKRKTEDCPRRLLPVLVEVLVDGQVLFRVEQAPTGLAGDGASRFYARADVPAGRHELTLRLRDSDRRQGFDHEGQAAIELAPAQILVVGFDAESNAFTVR